MTTGFWIVFGGTIVYLSTLLLTKYVLKEEDKMSKKKSDWIPVKNRLPEENIDCLCLTPSGIYMVLKYNTKHKLFNVNDDYIEPAILVEYWMPLPEPPPLPSLKREIVPQKSRYEKMVEHHQCVDCGKPLPEGYKPRRCQECQEKHIKYMRIYNKNKKENRDERSE